MAHELEIVDGKAQMAYVNEVPWHGLGVKVDPDITPEEILKVAGLDWTVEKREVMFTKSNGEVTTAPKKNALVRSHDDKFLDIVGADWVPVQNADALNFFDDYVKEGGMTMETAGSLKDGQIIWALAKVNESFSLFDGADEVESYLLLSNPHQFGRGVDIRFTPIRVVCNNTLTLSLDGKAATGISLNHRSEFDANRVHDALKEAHTKMEDYGEMSQFLASKRYTQETLFEYFNRVFPKTSNKTSFEDMLKEWKSNAEKVGSRNARLAMDYVETQPGAEYGEGTFWQAYNTVTYMTNHVVGHSSDSRLQSTWFGSNKDKNIQALGLALEMAEAA
jgi:phage/plasmid-like protein (TIGR03299 family)